MTAARRRYTLRMRPATSQDRDHDVGAAGTRKVPETKIVQQRKCERGSDATVPAAASSILRKSHAYLTGVHT